VTFAPDFLFSKTTWTAVVAIVVAVWSAFHHSITWHEATLAIFAALGTAFHRDAVAKSGS
jgi:hypothetical protein